MKLDQIVVSTIEKTYEFKIYVSLDEIFSLEYSANENFYGLKSFESNELLRW
jgi:hypothetical protein